MELVLLLKKNIEQTSTLLREFKHDYVWSKYTEDLHVRNVYSVATAFLHDNWVHKPFVWGLGDNPKA